jgi:hypothetical protein
MERQSYSSLFESILAKCRREGWYGPQLDCPQWEDVDENDPRRVGFEFGSVDETQLQATENILGFPLLPLLRELYATIANGGFGPGGGLRGVIDGFESVGSGYALNSDDTMVANYLFWSCEKVGAVDMNESILEQMKTSGLVEIERGLWSSQLLPVCDMGCVQEACLDNRSGHVFLVVAVNDDNKYGLMRKEWTFEEWLWRWVRGEKTW